MFVKYVLFGIVIGGTLAWLLLLLFSRRKVKDDKKLIIPEEEWYRIERNIINELIAKGNDPMVYINHSLVYLNDNPEKNHENALLTIKEELINFKTNKQDLKVITKEEWLEEEIDNVNELIVNEKDPLAYINKALRKLEKTPEENHKAALLEILNELTKPQEEVEDNEEEIIELEDITDDAEEDMTLEEVKVITEKHSAKRELYIQEKRRGNIDEIPLIFFFTLSREDIFEHMDRIMQWNKEKFPIKTNKKIRYKKHLADSLRCGEWCFGLMYERLGRVIKFTLRMSDKYAKELSEKYTSIKCSLFPKGSNWYDLIIDGSFVSKKEVYEILEECYKFVLKRYYTLNELDEYETNIELAQMDYEEINKEVIENQKVLDVAQQRAIEEYELARRRYKEQNVSKFKITRKYILNYTRKIDDKDISVIENEKTYLPGRLKIKTKTYALVYERLKEVTLVVKMSEEYADWLSLTHPEVRKAKFPRSRYWYIVPVTGYFKSVKGVQKVLKASRRFVRNQ